MAIALATSTKRTLLCIATCATLLSLPMATQLPYKLAAKQQMHGAVQKISARVVYNDKILARLRKAYRYANSPAYVEHWARVQVHWNKPNENMVVTVGRTNTEPRLWWEKFLIDPN